MAELEPIKYFSLTGSYEGGIKLEGVWYHVSDLNLIDKSAFEKIDFGSMRPSVVERCLKKTIIPAYEMFPQERA